MVVEWKNSLHIDCMIIIISATWRVMRIEQNDIQTNSNCCGKTGTAAGVALGGNTPIIYLVILLTWATSLSRLDKEKTKWMAMHDVPWAEKTKFVMPQMKWLASCNVAQGDTSIFTLWKTKLT